MSYVVKIKNVDTGVHTWVGKSFAAGEEYTIPSADRQKWADADDIMAAITAGEAQVGDGSYYFSTAAKGINWLVGNVPASVKTVAINEPDGKRARLVGMHSGTATKNTTTTFDWLIPQLSWQGNDKSSIFDGVQYYAQNAKIGDSMDFQVVDLDGFGVLAGWYTQAQFDAMGNVYVVEEFGTGFHAAPDALEDILLYKGSLIVGLYIRIKYTSTSTTTDVEFMSNLFRHLEE